MQNDFWDLAKIPYPELTEEKWNEVVFNVFEGMQENATMVFTHYVNGYQHGTIGKCVNIDNENCIFVVRSGTDTHNLPFEEITNAYIPQRWTP